MRTTLNLQAKADDKLYLPERAKIVKIRSFSDKEKAFEMELLDRKTLGHMPGQFLQVSVMGHGEAAISISSAPSADNRFVLSIRAVGDVTNKIHSLKEGDIFHVRGPFGDGFNNKRIQHMQGKHLLFIVGGTGFFPFRSLIQKIIPERDKYKKITVLYGAKTPKDRMYPDELEMMEKLGGNFETMVTVDRAEDDWKGNVGVITTLIPKVELDPRETVAIMFGPPIMFKFVLKSLIERKIAKENMYIDLERRMKCGVGKCGHCQMEGIYVCQEGPVFNYAEVEVNEEVL
jgi:sulfhydrogenase subunit gamma (sulfur reductase)